MSGDVSQIICALFRVFLWVYPLHFLYAIVDITGRLGENEPKNPNSMVGGSSHRPMKPKVEHTRNGRTSKNKVHTIQDSQLLKISI